MRTIPAFILATTSSVMLACSAEQRVDVSSKAEFRQLVGMEYEVIGSVDAYGIRAHSQAPVEYVTLIPPPGIAGGFVGFQVPLKAGSTVVVQKVLKTNRWPDPDVSYDVLLKGTELPVSVPVRIDLFRGNEGKEKAELNPELYRPLNPRR